MPTKGRKPEWVPPDATDAFATSIRHGVEGGHDGLRASAGEAGEPGGAPSRRSSLSGEEYVRGVCAGDRTVLARAITLIESNAPAHQNLAQEVLQALLPFTGKSIRIGITGVPGAGKSTFIEALGKLLTGSGHRVAVLAIDPSSSVTHGSVLGDKTRMENLSRDPLCFIRPSPSGGTLGGVARKTRESMLLCEAAGYDVVLIETMGVGQSEITVRSMVDFFLLLLITGAGDELQGIKKGVIELADLVVINKADGENRLRAEALRVDYTRALHYLAPATQGWSTPVQVCSALTGDGVLGVWECVDRFRGMNGAAGTLAARRNTQMLEWVHTMVEEHLHTRFFTEPRVQHVLPDIERAVLGGTMTAATAVRQLLHAFEQRPERSSS
jgi:LAO/AO transport system kinase